MTAVGPLFSAQIWEYLSLGSYHAFYTMIPLYLCVAAGLSWLLQHRAFAVKAGAFSLLIAVLLVQALSLGVEIERHRQFIDDLVRRWPERMGSPLFVGQAERRSTREDEILTIGTSRSNLDEGGVGALAVAHQIVARIPRPERPDAIVLVRIDGPIPGGSQDGLSNAAETPPRPHPWYRAATSLRTSLDDA